MLRRLSARTRRCGGLAGISCASRSVGQLERQGWWLKPTSVTHTATGPAGSIRLPLGEQAILAFMDRAARIFDDAGYEQTDGTGHVGAGL
jgi:hypothetical protein